MHNAHGSSGGLKTAVLEASHLHVEAFTQTILTANQILFRNEPITERYFETVHTPITQSGDSPALHSAAVILGEFKTVTFRLGLGHNEQAETAMGLATVSIGASQQHQHVCSSGKRAPCLDPVDDPPAVDGSRCDLQISDVRSIVGFSDCYSDHRLASRNLREPLALLFLGSTSFERPSQNLRPRDEGTASTQRCARKLFGSDHHSHVVTFATSSEAAVFLRN